ncbi:LPS-assembly protein LptD [Sphingomonas hankyongi]|uniref:LPS-assembly protein LptD n=1 Tax=Sphingomonas hankyongi TaxID=2908209 RepID=A0ABT0S3Y3_9SPHN|nr:LPS assembly protein LptD [Sphingomonas hankyongi]MCL6730577.1 LPS assembly protein LptD [Sphingomonas hankyongi]
MRRSFAWWIALPVAAASAAVANAQTIAPAPQAAPAATEPVIEFSADAVTYDSNSDVVTATGAVRMEREGNYLAADEVVWNRNSGEVRALGNVVILTPEGDKLVGENVVLTDTLRDGTVDNLLVVLDSGGRIAAARGTRSGRVTTLENAIYSPCPVTTESGCPRRPSWSITAARVLNDPSQERVRFEGGRLQLLGITLPLLPVFSFGTGTNGDSGWLTPDFSLSTKKGLEVAVPYHWQIAPNRDFTVTPHLYTGVWPALEAKYRQLDEIGAFQIGGFVTYGEIESADPTATDEANDRGIRAYFEANGRAQLDPYWSITSSLRVATDKTVTRRYDITRDDRLRNVINVERISPNSYITIAGWAFQGLRSTDEQDRIPFALPAIDAHFRLPNPVAGGRVEIQANSLSILRIDGQDTQRAFASARWDLRRLTPWGQELTLTGYARGDVYHTDEVNETAVAIYRGTEGWHTRGIGALAADLKWPLIGPALGGTQRLVPRLQVVLTPPTENLEIPNEDARSIDLEDSNLFALNRFPGYDRWEDGSRVTYGFDWALDRPKLSIMTTIGQSYRITTRQIFPEGTGLTDRFSDIVGRTRIRYGRLIDITHRFRLDKDNLAVRRNEVDLTLGSEQTYVQVGYLRLNRDIDPLIEDLRDKEELRLAGRILFHRYWSIFGATVIDLTSQREDPLSTTDGFNPVRHRLGLTYEDECLELGVSWRRDYEDFGTFRKGSTFALRFSLKGLGR